MTLASLFGKPISTYSRAQAIEDGVLVDLSDTPEARECGYKFPVACTRAVWESHVAWAPEDSARQVHQDEKGRLWDVLYMLMFAVRRHTGHFDRITFDFYCVPRGGRSKAPRHVWLQAQCGPGDDLAPTITIMKLEER